MNPHFLSAHLGQGTLAQLLDPSAMEPQLSTGGAVEATEQVKQHRLAAPARPHHRHLLAWGDVEVDSVHRADKAVAPAIFLAQSPCLHKRAVRHRSLLR
jgi:hypothetical protein